MKKIISLSLLTASLFLVSCSKEKMTTDPVMPEDQGPLNEKLLVKTAIGADYITFEYYPDRKLKTKINNKQGDPVRSTEYIYEPGSVTLKEFENGLNINSWIYKLNNKGQIISTNYKQFNANGDIVFENNSSWTYNAAGQLVKEDWGSGDYIEYSYVDGNLTQSRTFAAGQPKWETKCQYYADKKTKNISYEQFGDTGLGGILPVFSKNLISRLERKDMLTQALITDNTYTYELDSDGFVLKRKAVNAISGITYEWINTFQ
jgi:hypothetical protein